MLAEWGGSGSEGKAGLELAGATCQLKLLKHLYKGSLAAKGSTLHVSMYGDILRKYEKSFVKTNRTREALNRS